MQIPFPAITSISDMSKVRFALVQGQQISSVPGTGIPFQPVDADLTAIAALAKTDGNIIVGNGTTWVAESGNTARTSLELGTGNTPQFTGLSIGAAFTLAPVHVGDRNVENSVDSQVLVSRNVTGTSGNGHAFSDSSDISRSGTIGYNSFDGRVNFTGTADFDHYTAFQALGTYNSSGTMTDMNPFFGGATLSAGTVTNYKCFWAGNPTGAGTLTNAYGVYIENITKGTTLNYAVYTVGTTPSRFNGAVTVGAGADATTTPGTSLYVTNAGTTTVAVRNSTSDIESYWAVDASAGYIGNKTNNSFSIFTNDTNRMTITGAGAASFTGALSAASLSITEGAIAVGTWTPTLTHVANVAASTAFACYYIRIGSHVFCWGQVNVDPTLDGDASTHLGISLPIASNFGATGDAGGTGAPVASAQRAASIDGDAANDRVRFRFLSQVLANTTFVFNFGYRII